MPEVAAILLSIGGLVWIIGTFVAAPKMARAHAEEPTAPHCHQEYADLTPQTRKVRLDWAHCQVHHAQGCWRRSPSRKTEVTMHDAAQGLMNALTWPVVVLSGGPLWVIKRQANKNPSREMLKRQVKALEKELGMRDQDADVLSRLSSEETS